MTISPSLFFKSDKDVARQNIDPTYVMPSSISDWPAYGNPANAGLRHLAPFHDVNDDGFYNPEDGDYPDYNVTGNDTTSRLYGDETLWWVFNDKGNIHSETQAEPLGLEIHAQAFGFAADNELNDMTFYNYLIINRSTLPLNDTYFGQWVDPDLGYYLDDYVGCDVSKGLGFCYNGDAEDEGGDGYGFNPPAIGVDFFQGPIADPGDGIDNDRDGTVDEPNEEIIMSKFVYYNNDFTVIGNPSEGIHFYNYLRGIWKDNVPMTYGGDGHGSGAGSTTELCNFMFPGTSDPDFAQEWTEVTAGNIPADRRFLQSAGPFTLQPGAVNEITTGVVWARAKSGGQTASINLVKVFDIEAQALFNSNFNILNGPDAPDLEIRELDRELILTLSNGPTSNNIDESYSEKDPYIFQPINLQNSPNYEFQGYLVYQLKDETVSQTDLDDPDLARLVFRCDVKDGVQEIINHYKDEELGVWTPVVEVDEFLSDGVQGSVDQGTQYSFQITEDRFALGNTRLVNHKTYYYMTIAYGYNPAEENANPYDPSSPGYDGKNQPFIRGRRNIDTYHGIPRRTEMDAGGTQLNSSYGDGVKITRIEGSGNGGNGLEFTETTIDNILESSNNRTYYPTYKAGKGPLNISVVDPVKIPEGSYILKLQDPITTSTNSITSYAKWTLSDSTSGNVIATNESDILVGKQQYVESLGLSIEIKQSSNPGIATDSDNGFISGELEFEDPTSRWLTGVPDYDESFFRSLWGLNWIRAGSYDGDGDALLADYNVNDDPEGIYESAIEQTMTVSYLSGVPFIGNFSFEITGGTWAPYRFVSHFQDGPGISSSITNQSNIDRLNSVDIVFTSDKDKWTRCCVVEAQDDENLSIGGQAKMGLRQSPSVDKNGNEDNTGTMGMGWFPGYAIDLETGERLNIIFSEDSWQTSENGNNMLWDPTSRIVTDEFPLYNPSANPGQQFSGGDYLLGGKHFIYVVGGEAWVKGTEEYTNGDLANVDQSPSYDSCAWAYTQLLDDNTGAGKWKVFKNITWVGAPLLAPGKTIPTSNNPNDAKVKLRVTKPYRQYETVAAEKILDKNQNLIIGNTYVVAYQNAATTWGGQSINHAGNTYEPGMLFEATSTSFSGSAKARVIEHIALNSFNPTYSFNTMDVFAEIGNGSVAMDAMKDINVVPNPYYGYSSYETDQLDNRIKITNLPRRATISIYTISGTLVRKIKKDNTMASIDWDLKNDSGIPIASGLYIIHVRTYIKCEISGKYVEKDKVIKWFGALRPIDLDTF